MAIAESFVGMLAYSSVWLTVSGLVLWLCLRSRLPMSPGTQAAASFLILLQGWLWFGIPVHLHLARLEPTPSAGSSPNTIAVTAQHHVLPAHLDVPLSRRPDALNHEPDNNAFDRKSVADVAAMAWWQIARWLIVLWLGGIAIALWRSVRAQAALSRLVRRLPLAPLEWQAELTNRCADLAIKSQIELRVGNVATPILVQTWQSASIVFPAWLWESCTIEQRTSILRHELAHYRRRDIWRLLAVRLLALPHWFNPVAWWAARQFEAATEAACDEAACGGNALEAVGYAKALLYLSERLSNRHAQALSLSGGSLSERIRRILSPEFQKEPQMSRFLILSSLFLLTGLATIRIQAADPPSPTKGESSKNETSKDEPTSSNTVSILPNGGFEQFEEETGDPLSWYATRIPNAGGIGLAGHYVLSASPKLAHGGKRSVAVAIGENHPSLPVHYNWTTEVQGWKAGETYELSGWIKTENAQQPAFIMVQFWDKNEDPKARRMIGGAGTEKAFPIKGDTEWTKVSTRFTVPEGTGSLRLRAGLSSKGNRGAKAWLDDLALVKVAN